MVYIRGLVRREETLLDEQLHAGYCRADRLFVALLPLEWIAAVCVALLVSPTAWAGPRSSVHVHLWTACLLGGAIIVLPLVMALRRPGEARTRHLIAIGQMFMGALLIHLMAGRIEAHFYIFVSLAFLARSTRRA